MGRRRKAGKYPYDYTAGDDGRFAESGVGGRLRVLHGPGRGMGVPEGVLCQVEVVAADGAFLDESHAGKFGKEHRLRDTAPGDRITVEGAGRFAGEDECDCGSGDCVPVLDELTSTCQLELTGDLDDVVRIGVGPAWDEVPTPCRWGDGARIRGGRLTRAAEP